MRELTDLREKYLSQTVVPKGRLIVDRWLPLFDGSLHVPYDDGVILPGVKIGDDYYDLDAGNHWLWGDSDSVTSGGSFAGYCRIVCPGIATGSTTRPYCSWWTDASPSWAMARASALPSSRAVAQYCRPGVRDKGDGTVYFWFVQKDDGTYDSYLCRVSYNPATDTWGSVTETSAAFPIGFSGTIRSLACHPVADDECAVFSLIDNQLMLSYIMGVGGDYYRRNLVLGLSDDYPDDMAVWSDAEAVPSYASRVIAMCNMTRWGQPKTVRIIADNGVAIVGMPRPMVPADPDWGNIKARPMGLSAINGYLEAVLFREPVDSNGDVVVPHTILASSYNGHGWHEDVLVTKSDCRGKYLYAGSGQYGYVVGNVSVARCTAGAQQGSDYSGITQTLSPITSLGVSYDGPGSAPSIQASVPDTDGALLVSGLVAPPNRVRAYLGDARLSGSGWGLIHTGEISDVTLARAPATRAYSINAMGLSARAFGDGSYKPCSSVNLLAPKTESSRFEFETGEERLTVIAKEGTWEVVDNTEDGGKLLQCEAGGIAMFAEQMEQPNFFARIRARYRTQLRGLYILFWYEDEDNYYRAGLRNTAAPGGWLEIDRCVDGVITNLKSETLASFVARDTWFTLMLSCTANNITIYYMNDGGYDYSTAYKTAQVALDTDDTSAPVPYSLGVYLDDLPASDEGVHDYEGTVTDAEADWLQDTSCTWTFEENCYLYCKEHYHKIQSYDAITHTFALEDYWGETPEAGEAYYVVPAWLMPGPTLQVYSAYYSEMVRPLSAEDLGTWVLDACGAVRDWGSANSLPAFDDEGSAVFMRDAEVAIVASTTPTTGPEIAIWGKSQRANADPDYDATAVRIRIRSDHAEVDYCQVSDASETAWISKHPYPAYATVEEGVEYEFRIQAWQDGITISIGDRALAAFPVGLGAEPFLKNEGYCGYLGDDPAGTYREFPMVCDVTWDTAETASSFLGRVFQGLNLRPIERADGSIRLGRQYDPLGDLGEWQATVTKIDAGQGKQKGALLELAGAEGLTFYLNESMAYQGLSFERQDNPNLWTIPGLEFEAKRMSERGEEQLAESRFALHAPDPSAELDDEVEVDGEHYRIEGVRMQLSMQDDKLQFSASFKARLEDLDHFNPSAWGTGVWGQFTWDS